MKRFEYQCQDFKWIDCEAPSLEELLQLSEEFHIPSPLLSSSLDPEHLPRCEFLDEGLFIILRHQDPEAKASAATMQELTTKLIFFIGEDFLLTVHRMSLPCITERRNSASCDKLSRIALTKQLFIQTIRSFDIPLDELDAKTDIIEARVFSLKRRSILREGYMVKRKISSYRKVFKFTSDILSKIHSELEISSRDFSQVREPLDKCIFYADEVHEEISGLLNLHLSLMSQKTNQASYRTNEVMRILTVFSIFFLPLNFIAGIYGMNFEHMPELKHPQGYYMTLTAMVAVVIGITFWIYRKGWIKKEEL